MAARFSTADRPRGSRASRRRRRARYLFGDHAPPQAQRTRAPTDWLPSEGVTRNNLHGLDVAFPLGVLTTVTGVSGSGKSSLVSQALVELVANELGHRVPTDEEEGEELERTATDSQPAAGSPAGMEAIRRLVRVDQKPIGRTPRSNLATYTGLFDHVRKLFAATKAARARHYDAGRFSFNVAKGRCETCEGEGFVMVELLFLPSVYAPCPTCHGARYNAKTLEDHVSREEHRRRARHDRRRGVGVLRRRAAGSPRRSTCCAKSGSAISGWASRRPSSPAAKRSASSSRPSCSAVQRGNTLYVLDEPTTGLHPADVEKLMRSSTARSTPATP